MQIKMLDSEFSVCKVADYSHVDWTQNFFFLGKTDEENSLVCPSDSLPANVLAVDGGWRAFRIEGVLDFSLIGILANIAALLAGAKIGIFAVSTYNTDYILTKRENFVLAIDVLQNAGYEIV